jgi:hypothetical protein
MTKPNDNPADPFKKALATLAFCLLAIVGLASRGFSETQQRCDEGVDFEAEFERVWLHDPNVVAKCEVNRGTVVRFVDPLGPFPNGGSSVSEGQYTFLSDKIDVVNGTIYLRRYAPKPLDCGEIEDLPSHVLLNEMTCEFDILVTP